uniref:class B sortase n=1 Tax=Agathobacter sp. TaxID=2021311 RepID=UPI004056B23A
MGNENRKKKSNPIIYKILFIVFLVIFIVASSTLIKDWYKEKKAQDKFEELSSLVTEKETETETEIETESETEIDELAERGITVPEKNLNWNALYEENEHIVAWIYIPGTKVDYPILQHPEVDDYYLNRNLDGSSGYPGCIYIETVNNKNFTDYNTLVYGHNMKNDTMFGSLHDYENAVFFDKYRYVYVYTPETTLVYDIFASYMHTNDHIYYSYDFGVAEGYQDYIDFIFSIRDMSANIREDAEVTSDTPMLTMSTCMGGGKENNRYVVNAVLVNKSALKVYEEVQE